MSSFKVEVIKTICRVNLGSENAPSMIRVFTEYVNSKGHKRAPSQLLPVTCTYVTSRVTPMIAVYHCLNGSLPHLVTLNVTL